MAIESGKKVKIDYEGRFENGEVFDASSKHGKPLEFTIGGKQVIKGFEDAIVNMEINEEKEITIEPKSGYGEYREELKRELPKDKFPTEPELKEGMMLMMRSPDGQQFPANVKEIKENTVVIDLNHPLAGKTLIFKLKLLEVN